MNASSAIFLDDFDLTKRFPSYLPTQQPAHNNDTNPANVLLLVRGGRHHQAQTCCNVFRFFLQTRNQLLLASPPCLLGLMSHSSAGTHQTDAHAENSRLTHSQTGLNTQTLAKRKVDEEHPAETCIPEHRQFVCISHTQSNEYIYTHMQRQPPRQIYSGCDYFSFVSDSLIDRFLSHFVVVFKETALCLFSSF